MMLVLTDCVCRTGCGVGNVVTFTVTLFDLVKVLSFLLGCKTQLCELRYLTVMLFARPCTTVVKFRSCISSLTTMPARVRYCLAIFPTCCCRIRRCTLSSLIFFAVALRRRTSSLREVIKFIWRIFIIFRSDRSLTNLLSSFGIFLATLMFTVLKDCSIPPWCLVIFSNGPLYR